MNPFKQYPLYQLPADTPRWSSSFEKPNQLVDQYIQSLITLLVKNPLKILLRKHKLSQLSLQYNSSCKPSLVLGGGPSLILLDNTIKNRDLSNKYNIFACNYFNSYMPPGISPGYVIFSDPNTIKPLKLLAEDGTDPSTLNEISKKQQALFQEIEISRPKIFVPSSFPKSWLTIFPEKDISYFNDSEARFFNSNVNPLFPRCYTSMTAYKAIAISLFISHSPCHILGIDNSYPHDILVSPSNNVCRLERHAQTPDHYIIDHSPLFSSVADALVQMSVCFSDLHKFPSNRIMNLDPYSLVDAFPKINKNIYDFLLSD